MSEFERQKLNITRQIQSLCAHCSNGIAHTCQIKPLVDQVNQLSGVPLIINNHFSGLLFSCFDPAISSSISGGVNN